MRWLKGLAAAGVLAGAFVGGSLGVRNNGALKPVESVYLNIYEDDFLEPVEDFYKKELEEHKSAHKSGEFDSCAFTRDLSELEKALKEKSFCYTDENKLDFDVVDYSMTLYKKLTGESLGRDFKITKKTKEDDSVLRGGGAAYHDENNDRIVYNDNSSDTFVLGRLLHELGHVACDVGERQDAHDKNNPDVKAIEEAGAYLFTLRAINRISEERPVVAKDLYDNFLLNRGLEYTHLNDDDEHKKGVCLARAALDHFKGDSSGAFNYINKKDRIEEYDPCMIRDYENYLNQDQDNGNPHLDGLKDVISDYHDFQKQTGSSVRTLDQLLNR